VGRSELQQLRALLGATWTVRRVPVADLRPVRGESQRAARERSAGHVRDILGPWSASRFWSQCWTAAGATGAKPGVSAAWDPSGQEEAEAPTKEYALTVPYCRVCGDCEFGSWGIDAKLGVLVCEGCDDAFATLDRLTRRDRLRFWEFVGHVVSGWVLVSVEWGGRQLPCAVCAIPVGGYQARVIYSHDDHVVGELCQECALSVRYVANLGPLRVEVLKAHARRQTLG